MKKSLNLSALIMGIACLWSGSFLEASLTVDSDLLISGNFESVGSVKAEGITLYGSDVLSGEWDFSVDTLADVLSLTHNDQEVMRVFKEGYIRFRLSDLDPESWFPYNNEGDVYFSSNADIVGTGDFVFRRWGELEGYEVLMKVNGLNGNVGIGTDDPSQKLEIEGNLKVNGSIVMEPRGDIPMFDSASNGE